MTIMEMVIMVLKDIGAYNIGQNLETEEAQDVIKSMNTMVDLWNIGLAIYASTQESFALTVGKASYTWGIATPAADFNSARPVKLTNAFIRDSGNNDYPVDIITQLQYDGIPEKTDTGRPYCLFYNPTYPLGIVYPFYVPDLDYTLHLDSEKDLGNFVDLTDTIVLPPEYMAPIRWNLGAELCPSYKKPVPPKIELMARESLAIIKRLHASEKLRPVKMNEFPTTGPGGYWKAGDIRSGQPY